jgi:dTDP-4-amino-4,6-dideoxygalactose transaminase
MTIPLHRPTLTGGELRNAGKALKSGQIAGSGPFTTLCETLLEERLKAPRVLLTSSCTHALEMAAMLIDIAPGDEIIVPSYTFVSTANAFISRGARPVFIEVREDTLNIDTTKLLALISPRTRAIIPVHYAGVSCEMVEVNRLAKRNGVLIVEDNAQGLFSRYNGRFAGTFSPLSVVSFHATKNFSAGEGGALIINDPSFIDRAEIIRQNGTDRSQFMRGKINSYSWRDIGSSYLLSDVLASILYAQLQSSDRIMAKLRIMWVYYYEQLHNWAKLNGILLPVIPDECEPAYHLFYLRLTSPNQLAAVRKALQNQGITSAPHFMPLHLSAMGRRFGYHRGDLPVTEKACECLLRLPFYYGLTKRDQSRVIRAVTGALHAITGETGDSIHSSLSEQLPRGL